MTICGICKKADGVNCRHYRHRDAGIIVADETVEIAESTTAEQTIETIHAEEAKEAVDDAKAPDGVEETKADEEDAEEKPSNK